MRHWMNLVEDNSDDPDRLGFLTVSGILGQPLDFKNISLRNQRAGAGGYGYEIEILRGKKWLNVPVSPLRISKANASLDPYNKISGGVWFFEKDRQTAENDLRNAIRKVLSGFRDKIDVTLNTLSD